MSDSVFNLSKRDLSEAEISLLSKGLKFCPTPKGVDKSQIKNDLEQFGRRLRLKWFFRNEEDTYEINPFKPKSTFNPRNVDTSIEVYLSCLEEELLNVSAHGNNYSNLTVQELNFFTDFYAHLVH